MGCGATPPAAHDREEAPPPSAPVRALEDRPRSPPDDPSQVPDDAFFMRPQVSLAQRHILREEGHDPGEYPRAVEALLAQLAEARDRQQPHLFGGLVGPLELLMVRCVHPATDRPEDLDLEAWYDQWAATWAGIRRNTYVQNLTHALVDPEAVCGGGWENHVRPMLAYGVDHCAFTSAEVAALAEALPLQGDIKRRTKVAGEVQRYRETCAAREGAGGSPPSPL